MKLHRWMAAILVAGAAPAAAARLTQSAEQAFDTYIAGVEARMAKDPGAPVTRPPGPADREVSPVIDPVNGGSWPVPGSRLHHWRAAALVPGASAAQMLALLADHDHLARYYTPDVVSSKTLRKGPESATIAMRFEKHQIVTVVLDAEFRSQSALLAGGSRGFSSSRSLHIWQVDHPGSAQERRRAEGDDDGFLWRLNSYWSFQESSGGLWIECEAVSLTRDVPTGLGWLIVPIIQSLPRESLLFTLSATKKALLMRTSPNDRAN